MLPSVRKIVPMFLTNPIDVIPRVVNIGASSDVPQAIQPPPTTADPRATAPDFLGIFCFLPVFCSLLSALDKNLALYINILTFTPNNRENITIATA